MHYDWSIPVTSLLNTYQKRGFKLVWVHDGDDVTLVRDLNKVDARRLATDCITSVDESHLKVSYQGESAVLYIVLGNDPDELVANYSYPSALETMLEDALEEHVIRWEGKKCPLIAIK